MKTFSKVLAVLILAVMGSTMVFAQEKEAPKEAPRPREFPVYKLDFVIAELEDGKRVNSRAYTMLVQERSPGQGSVNVSTRVPVALGSSGATQPQVQYMDVGLGLDYRVREESNWVIVEGRTRIESFADAQPQSNSLNMPVTRRISIDSQAAVTPGKPTVIGSADDVNSKKRYEVQVTATKIK